jgi:hypothetical protein
MYSKLVSTLDVTAELEVDSSAGEAVSGSWRLDVSVRNSNGWSHTSSTGRSAPVGPLPSRLVTEVPVAELLALAKRVDDETGVPSGPLTIDVTAVVELGAGAGGGTSDEQASSVLSFTADGSTVTPDPETPLVQTLSTPGVAEVRTPVLRLVGLELPPDTTRGFSLLAAAVLSAPLLALGLLRRRQDEDARIATTAKGRLVQADATFTAHHVVIDVSSFEALLQVAETYDRMVVWAEDGGLRYYFVFDDDIAYRYYSKAAAALLDSRADPVAADSPADAFDGPERVPVARTPEIPQQRAGAEVQA